MEREHGSGTPWPDPRKATLPSPDSSRMSPFRATGLDTRATKSKSSLRGLPIYSVRTVHDCIQEALEARAPLRNGWGVEPARNLLRDPGRIDAAAEQMFQMKFGVLNLVRFRSVDLSEPPAQPVSEIGGIGKIPGFEMPLRAGEPDSGLDLATQTSG